MNVYGIPNPVSAIIKSLYQRGQPQAALLTICQEVALPMGHIVAA